MDVNVNFSITQKIELPTEPGAYPRHEYIKLAEISVVMPKERADRVLSAILKVVGLVGR